MRLLARIGIGLGMSAALGALVFGAAYFLTSVSHAFYAGLAVAVVGIMLLPFALSAGSGEKDKD